MLARSLLDRELTAAGIQPSQLPGYNTQATGHLHVAAAIAAGLADAGIASESAALGYGLAFIPLAFEHFDLVIPAAHINAREVHGLLKVLSSTWLLDQIANLPGLRPSPLRGTTRNPTASAVLRLTPNSTGLPADADHTAPPTQATSPGV